MGNSEARYSGHSKDNIRRLAKAGDAWSGERLRRFEQNAQLCWCENNFARFASLRWKNPLASR
jgi:DNA-binding transcriptional regulator WhiA